MQVARVYNWLIGQLNFGGGEIDSRFCRSYIWRSGNDRSGRNNEDERYKGSNEIAEGGTQVILSAPRNNRENKTNNIYLYADLVFSTISSAHLIKG